MTNFILGFLAGAVTMDELATVREAAAIKDARTALANTKVAQPLTKKQAEAEEVLAAMDSGEWSVSRNKPSHFLTDEANRKFAWVVKREYAPYGDKEGNRQWTGPTAIEALRKGKEAIEIMKGV